MVQSHSQATTQQAGNVTTCKGIVCVLLSYPCEQHELTCAAILFWLNCKSVYSYWQNERKQLNAEVSKIECVTASGLLY